MKLKFKAKKTKTRDQMAVVYSCNCGCTPEARYARGSDESGHEHCCCGKVHFAGPNAEQELNQYLTDRRQKGEDDGLEYEVMSESVKAPWGEKVPVAYALPYVEGGKL